MVEKRKNYLKLLFCVVLAVILPFSFVGCKTKTNPNQPDSSVQTPPDNDDGDNNDSDDAIGDGQNEQPNQDVVFLASDVKNILLSKNANDKYVYTALCDDYVENLNTLSGKLQEKSYDGNVGENTASMLSCLYYPHNILYKLDDLNYDFELDKFYFYCTTNPREYDAIKVCVQKNEKIIIYMISTYWQNDAYGFEYNKLVLDVDDDKVTGLGVSKFSTQNGSIIDFQNARFDFVDFTLDLSCGAGILTNADNDAKKYLNDNFTSQNFQNVLNQNDAAFFYESLTFLDDTNNVSVYLGENSKDSLAEDFSNFGFLDAYETKEQCDTLESIIHVTKNIYAYTTLNCEKIKFNTTNYKFEKIQGA